MSLGIKPTSYTCEADTLLAVLLLLSPLGSMHQDPHHLWSLMPLNSPMSLVEGGGPRGRQMAEPPLWAVHDSVTACLWGAFPAHAKDQWHSQAACAVRRSPSVPHPVPSGCS